jgi:hypothetical protein
VSIKRFWKLDFDNKIGAPKLQTFKKDSKECSLLVCFLQVCLIFRLLFSRAFVFCLLNLQCL